MKDSIVQFVCFATNLTPDLFIPEWESFAKKLRHKKQEPNLLELASEAKNKFRYISQHVWPDRDFHFSFMNERKSEHFPEHKVRVVQAGGYVPLLSEKKYQQEDADVRLMAFVGHKETYIDAYRRMPHFHRLDIHQAYYESCAYGYILGFHVPEANADELLLLLQQRPGVEAGIYKECAVTA
ncbi:MAG: hypothetical protein HZB42_13105 [Sphingobacteriales bacterium]|nr:hypothetical protein [Sphingobacteriales bacterium]